MIYNRIEDGLEIKWNPKNKELGREVVKEVTGENDYPIEVSESQAEKIRERYAEYLEKKENEEEGEA